jgi:hypothetical protein
MLIPAQNLNKVNCKIQYYFANQQIKEDVKCNKYYTPTCNHSNKIYELYAYNTNKTRFIRIDLKFSRFGLQILSLETRVEKKKSGSQLKLGPRG